MAIRKRKIKESPFQELKQPYRILAESLEAALENLEEANSVADGATQELAALFDFSMCRDLTFTCEEALDFVIEPDDHASVADGFDDLILFLNEEGVRNLITDWDELESLIEADDVDAPVVEDCLDDAGKQLNRVYEFVTNLAKANLQ